MVSGISSQLPPAVDPIQRQQAQRLQQEQIDRRKQLAEREAKKELVEKTPAPRYLGVNVDIKA